MTVCSYAFKISSIKQLKKTQLLKCIPKPSCSIWTDTFLHSAGLPHLNETSWCFVPVRVHYCDSSACEDFLSKDRLLTKQQLFAKHHVEDTGVDTPSWPPVQLNAIQHNSSVTNGTFYEFVVFFSTVFCKGVTVLQFWWREERGLICPVASFGQVTWKM